MNKYINAENYKKDLIQLGFLPALVVRVLDKQPTADVVEVRHGEWKVDTEYYADDYSECNVRKVFRCSICGRTEMRKEPYCNCGAKMDGERRTDDER